MASGEDEAIGPDVASAGLHVSERIGRDAAAQFDLEEALEASRYASHPYSSHPKEDRLSSGEELVGDDDVARALLGACKGLPEPVLAVYDQLLSNGAIMPSLNLKLRFLRSVLAILREWGMSVVAHRLGITSAVASFFFDGTFSLNQTGTVNQGARDKIISLANRYMTEVRRLNLPQNQTENVYRGFRELEEKLLSPY